MSPVSKKTLRSLWIGTASAVLALRAPILWDEYVANAAGSPAVMRQRREYRANLELVANSLTTVLVVGMIALTVISRHRSGTPTAT